MKRRILLGILLPFLMVVFSPLLQMDLQAQTVWTTNGATDNNNGWKTVNFVGQLKGTDTLTTASFNLLGCDLNYNLARLFTQASDSVKITIKRQDSYIAGQWTVAKTIATSDSLKTAGYYADTLAIPNASRLLFIGTTGNGYNVNIKATIRARNR